MDDESFGMKAAIELLSSLNPTEQKKLLSKIAESEPKMAAKLRELMFSFNDLIYLTPTMLRDLLKSVSLPELGLALKVGSEELREFIFKNISKNMALEIKDGLEGKLVPISQAEEAVEKIMNIAREKLDRGEIVIDKSGEELV